jgi:hypothetical protein
MELDERSHILLTAALGRPADTTPYAALDVISELTSDDHFTFGRTGKDITFPGAGNGGVIRSATLHSSAAQGTLPDIDLYLFREDIVSVADNAAFAPTDVEMKTLIAILEFSAFKDGLVTAGAAGNSACLLNNLNKYFALSSNQFIYGQMVVQNTYTPVASEIFTAELTIERYGH